MRAQKIVTMLFSITCACAQQVARPTAPVVGEKPAPTAKVRAASDQEEELVVMTPFVVSSDRDNGYAAVDTLAGTRLRTDLKDVGAAIGVITSQFMEDTASVNAKDVLVYATSTEVGGVGGNTSGVTLTATASNNSGIFD